MEWAKSIFGRSEIYSRYRKLANIMPKLPLFKGGAEKATKSFITVELNDIQVLKLSLTYSAYRLLAK